MLPHSTLISGCLLWVDPGCFNMGFYSRATLIQLTPSSHQSGIHFNEWQTLFIWIPLDSNLFQKKKEVIKSRLPVHPVYAGGAVYGSSSIKNPSFGRNGIGDNQRHKRSTPLSTITSKTRQKRKHKKEKNWKWWQKKDDDVDHHCR